LKLTLDLIPQSSFFHNIRSEVSKSEWDKIRKIVYTRANYVCEICGGKGQTHPVEAHEIFEYDEINNIQKLIGLIALCPLCHSVKHLGLTQLRGREKEAIDQLMAINGMTLEETKKYVAKCFVEWQNRSKKTWTLDLSYLEQEFGIE
jgi:hypothetical protein